MSWNARRFKSHDAHHVPPRHPATTTPFKMKVRKIDHRAYHQLFANAASFEQCVEILWRDWWKPYYDSLGENHELETRFTLPEANRASSQAA